MIENKYVKILTCDSCGFSIEVRCDEDNMSALSENAIDWTNVRFDRLDSTEYTYKHLCPECSKKFLAMFEKDAEKEEEDNVDADGNEKRCDKCFYLKRSGDRVVGYCEKRNGFTYEHMHCGDFTGM